MCGGGTSRPPPPPPPPPVLPEAPRAAERATVTKDPDAKKRKRTGRQSTILTGSSGLTTQASTQQRTLLGQ